jgi:hypothetical protein
MHIVRKTAGLAGLTLMLTLSGCGPKPQPAPPSSNAPVADPNATPLGKSNAAGPFQVTLSATQQPVKVGDVRFAADVERDGVPVTDAKVKITLSMPAMGMPGPSADLKPENGRYVGQVQAGMAGDWQAEVAVASSGAAGKAAFVFPVKEK